MCDILLWVVEQRITFWIYVPTYFFHDKLSFSAFVGVNYLMKHTYNLARVSHIKYPLSFTFNCDNS